MKDKLIAFVKTFFQKHVVNFGIGLGLCLVPVIAASLFRHYQYADGYMVSIIAAKFLDGIIIPVVGIYAIGQYLREAYKRKNE